MAFSLPMRMFGRPKESLCNPKVIGMAIDARSDCVAYAIFHRGGVTIGILNHVR